MAPLRVCSVVSIGLLGGGLMMVGAIARAEAPTGTGAKADPTPTTWHVVDHAHETIGQTVLGTAEWFDAFFDDERIKAERNETRLKVELGVAASKGDSFDHDTSFSLRLRLPNAKQRLQLILSGLRNAEPEEEDPVERFQSADDRNEDERSLFLRYIPIRGLRRHLSFKTGFSMDGMRPTVVWGPRYRQTWTPEPWTVRYAQQVLWDSEDGVELEGLVDLERPFGARELLRYGIDVQWDERSEQLGYAARVSFFQEIGFDRAIAWQWHNQFYGTDDARLAHVSFAVRHRQALWRPWLLLETQPAVFVRRIDDFDPGFGISLRLEVQFGALD